MRLARGTPSPATAVLAHLPKLAVGLAAVAAGAVVAFAPTTALPIAVGLIFLIAWLAGLAGPPFVSTLAALLLGYMFLGRGFAHIGLGGVYIGDGVLAFALLTLVMRLGAIRFSSTQVLAVLFMLWGVATTLPYANQYGINALRDATIWGYAVFAFAVSVSIRREHFQVIRRWYPRLALVFVAWVPISWVVVNAFGNGIPVAPGSDVPILFFKPGDMAVHLAGAASFIFLSHRGTRELAGRLVSRFLVWVPAVTVISYGRAAFLAFSVAMVVPLAARRPSKQALLRACIGGILVLSLFLAAGPNLGASPGSRGFSVGDLATRVASFFGATDDPSLTGTRDYRLAWWGKIVDYTVNGPYFWFGKGYGINLADADGFQVTADDSLRAPHNTHIEILARSGVPGLLLWLALQVSIGWALLRRARLARRDKESEWYAIFVWLVAYWVAILVNTSFDPYLDGPQGGIWFWSLVGLGMAACRLWDEQPSRTTMRRRREVLRTEPATGSAIRSIQLVQRRAGVPGSDPRRV